MEIHIHLKTEAFRAICSIDTTINLPNFKLAKKKIGHRVYEEMFENFFKGTKYSQEL